MAQIYKEPVKRGVANIAVVGDLNDTPDSEPLGPLLEKTTLKDTAQHPKFDDGGAPGTHDSCTARSKIDYILLSPALMKRCKGGGIFREGMFVGTKGDKFNHYPEVTKRSEAASDHAAVWVELDF